MLTAIQDIFLAYNMFLILDEDIIPDIVRDEVTKTSYPVLGVIKQARFSASLMDEDSSSSSENSEEELSLNISQQMVSQFLKWNESLHDFKPRWT